MAKISIIFRHSEAHWMASHVKALLLRKMILKFTAVSRTCEISAGLQRSYRFSKEIEKALHDLSALSYCPFVVVVVLK